MKVTIKYYYDIDVDELEENDGKYHFKFQNRDFFFVFYNLNIEELETKRNIPQEDTVQLFTEKDSSLHTLEPAFINANADNLKGLSKVIRGKNVDDETAESLSEYMTKHKTEWAQKLLEDSSYNFNVPQYIIDAIDWLIDGHK